MHIVSKQRGKRRKAHFNASQELRWKMMSSKLSKDMIEKIGLKKYPIHKGDTVKVLTGNYKGKIGKVLKVDRKSMKVHVENCTLTRITGGMAYYPIHPSNLLITDLEIDDLRAKSIEAAKKIYDATKERYALKHKE